MTPLQLHTYQTPNGHKAAIMLEETGLPYRVHVVDIEAGAQHHPEFLALNPNNKIPVIVDPDRGRVVVESGAILFYLAERAGVLVPASEDERLATLQWTLFQAAHVGPSLGQLWNFKIFATDKIPTVIERFERESRRVLGVLNGALAARSHLAGSYGIADVMTWPWIHAAVTRIGLTLDAVPHLARWHAEVAARPAVQRGIAVPSLQHEQAA
ncbi:glutathione S-transferase family protein [Vineibacter terrae]|uniref:Glutathione S-transferase family protein n=1 Tax=Vineibacter terrae TaxID=2586908 RepID=A0A5C8PF50_9HYPH|nr:glutathione S-transferase N-terminal domain-containing protein [Vineibacter terrae]TXL71907.1 glutathione S-transferase family protein [Vineibacter terrae]